jgi:alkylation response protein AidB-like acyl-CoA dehydrogenase
MNRNSARASGPVDRIDAAAGDASAIDFVARARAIAPLVRSEAAATETSGTLSPNVVAAMRESELFWMLVPAELGGGAQSLTAAIEVIEEISCADGSSGWTLMANSTMTAVASAFCGEDAIDAMFGNGRRAVTAGMFGPGGKSIEDVDGYLGAGRFSFGSGCNHADWISAGMLVMEDGQPRRLPNGQPEVRVCFMPRDKVIFKGNWEVTGLAGTGSYDYEVPEQHIRRGFTLERTANIPLRGGPAFTLGLAAFACAGHAAVALGLMKRALMEVVGSAVKKTRPGYPSVIADHPIFREQFSVQEACYQACRQYVLHVFGGAEGAASAGEPITMEQRARFRQATTWAHQIAADVVRFCHFWSGTASIRASSVMGRCMRDVYAATQHVFVDPVTLADAAPAIMEPWAAQLRDTQPQQHARAGV